jgi:predicted Zn-dependent protease
MAAREVDDAQAAKTERGRSVHLDARIVGPTMHDAIGHALDGFALDRLLKINDSADTTHIV